VIYDDDLPESERLRAEKFYDAAAEDADIEEDES
jgi:hypothetical protein